MKLPGLGIKIDAYHKAVARTGPALALALCLALAGCGGFSETLQRGYVLQEGALEQIPIGASQEQVLIVLGTPSTVATINGEAFYYISQRSVRAAAFLPHEVVDQRVVAVYFDKDRRVVRLANYDDERRKDLRQHIADDADRRPGIQLPGHDLQEFCPRELTQ